jgi:hypothetical protein
MSNKIGIKEIKIRIFKAHGDTVSIIEDTFINTHAKATFIDINFGKWEAVVKDVCGGHGHQKRGRINAKKTCIKKYGVDSPKKVIEFKEKSKETSIKRYGTEHPMQNKEIRGKADITVLERYGTKNVSGNEDIKAKKRATTFKNFGVEYGAQSQIVQNTTKNTNMKKYGFSYPSQVSEIATKSAKASNISHIASHWKTHKEIVCRGNWELMVVDFLNANKIDFEWQPKSFKIPSHAMLTPKGNSVTYTPDLYLTKQDVWVEIKGWMRGDAQAKWDWFKTEYPTAELWNKEKLKEMGIL